MANKLVINETPKYSLSITEDNDSNVSLSVTDGIELQIALNGATGPTGPANVLEIGTVTTVESNVPASASITGPSPSQILNLTLPKGNTGAAGPQGIQGVQGIQGIQGAAGPNTITTSTSTNLTGYIFGNGTNIAGATTATKDGTPNTLVLRSAEGAATFSTNLSSVPAVTGINNSSDGGSGVYGYDYAAENGFGVTGESTEGTGVYGVSQFRTGVIGYSQNATGGESVSAGTTATYHHKFGDTGNNRSAVERIRGWFVWFFSTFTGRLKTADITANRDWTLPNVSGTIAITSNSDGSIIDASTTAKGIVELATVAESQAGTDSVRAVTPDGLPMRKVGTAWIGGDLTGNARGANALDVQSLRDSSTQVANQSEGINYGIRLTNNGSASTAVGNSVTIYQTSAYSVQNPSVGCSVFGVNGSAAGGFSTAIGSGSAADGDGCIAIGSGVSAIGDIAGNGSSTAIGAVVTASGNYNTAVGAFSNAVGPSGCTAIGATNLAEGDISTAIGYGSYAAGNESVAIGNSTTSSNFQTISIGVYSSATGYNDIAFGYNDIASGGASLAIGNGCESRSDSSIAIGAGSYVYNANTLRLNSNGSSPSYIRLHGNTGMCAMTVQNRSTEYDDAKRSQSVTITRSGTTATVALNAHGYSVGALVIIAGASQSAYNGTKTILSVATNSFTYEVTGSPATPATGTITAVAGDFVERDNTLARGEFAIRRNGLQFILDYNDAGTVKNIILGTAT